MSYKCVSLDKTCLGYSRGQYQLDVTCVLQELRGIGLAGYEAPEWKTKAMGKAPTFGYSDVRPIKEQRESLPVFKLRDQLIQAVNEHQVSVMPLA